MIKHWIITGDTHGWASIRIGNINRNMPEYMPEETGIIILGDAGFNFWLNKSDMKQKKLACVYGYHIYCVRGNHEERPENLGYRCGYDPEVQAYVYFDPNFPNIKYLIDGVAYFFGKHRAIVIGGAYSVDKWYRLKRAELANQKFSGWFESEQLTETEMLTIAGAVEGEEYDLVLSHTCPIDWEPNDLFISGIDQSMVDKTMEVWLGKIKDTFKWGVWLFGHYHADRVERPNVEQFYNDYEDLEVIWNRWYGEKTYAKEWWLSKSPYMEWWDMENEAKAKETND